MKTEADLYLDLKNILLTKGEIVLLQNNISFNKLKKLWELNQEELYTQRTWDKDSISKVLWFKI